MSIRFVESNRVHAGMRALLSARMCWRSFRREVGSSCEQRKSGYVLVDVFCLGTALGAFHEVEAPRIQKTFKASTNHIRPLNMMTLQPQHPCPAEL